MVFDRTRSYESKEIETGLIIYEELIISKALDIIAIAEDIPRDKVAEWVLDTYGGSLENAIINTFINLSWERLSELE